MTGQELIAKLKKSGTGEDKLAALAKALPEDASPEVVISTLHALGFYGTVTKACDFAGLKLAEPGQVIITAAPLAPDKPKGG